MTSGLRIAIIGAGRWTLAHHLPSIAASSHAEVTVVVDADEARARRAATLAAGARWATAIDEAEAQGLLDDIDGAVIATPHPLHAPLAMRLLERGTGVLVEKPISTSTSDAFRLVEVAERTSAPLVVGYTPLFTGAAARTRQWVSHEIGELLQVSVEFSSRAAALYSGYAEDPASAYSAANSAGQATTQLTHAIAALITTVGGEVARVAAFTAPEAGPVDIHDACAFVMRNGVTGVATSTGGLAPDQQLRHRVEYIGTHGRVSHDLLWSRAELRSGDGHRSVGPSHLEPAYPAGEPVRALLRLLRGEGPNPAPVRPAAATVAFTETLLESARTARILEVPALPRARIRAGDDA